MSKAIFTRVNWTFKLVCKNNSRLLRKIKEWVTFGIRADLTFKNDLIISNRTNNIMDPGFCETMTIKRDIIYAGYHIMGGIDGHYST